jgi:hypothetical protein
VKKKGQRSWNKKEKLCIGGVPRKHVLVRVKYSAYEGQKSRFLLFN